jgi:hypothetical protein
MHIVGYLRHNPPLTFSDAWPATACFYLRNKLYASRPREHSCMSRISLCGRCYYCSRRFDGQDRNRKSTIALVCIVSIIRTKLILEVLPGPSSTGVHFCLCTQSGSMQRSISLIGICISWLPLTTSSPPLDMFDASTANKIVRCLMVFT